MIQFAFDPVPRKLARRFPWWALLGCCALVAGLILVVSLMMRSPGAGGGGLRDDGLVIELVEIEKEGGMAGLKFTVFNPSETKVVKVCELDDPLFASYIKARDEHGNSYVLKEAIPSLLLANGIFMLQPKQQAKSLYPIMLPVEAATQLDIEVGPVVSNSSTTRRYRVPIKKIAENKGAIYTNPNPQVKVEVKDESLGIPGHVREGKKPSPIPVKIDKGNPGFFERNSIYSTDSQMKSRDKKTYQYKVYEMTFDAKQPYFIELRSNGFSPSLALLENGREVAKGSGSDNGDFKESTATITYTSPKRAKHFIIVSGQRNASPATGGFSIFVRLHDVD